MIEILLFAILAAALIATVFAFLAFLAARQAGHQALGRREAMELLRQEGEAIRGAGEANARGLRQELGQALAQNQNSMLGTVMRLADSLLAQVDAFGARLEASNKTTESRVDGIGAKLNADIAQMGDSAASGREALRLTIERRLDHSAAAHAEAARELREELNASFQRMRQGMGETLREAGEQQRERLDATKYALDLLTEKHGQAGEQLRQTVEGRLDMLRADNAAELEKVRNTVDEKLQITLEKRLDESFGRVVEQLNKAYEVFGEMRAISTSVGDLKNVLTNPKLRGTFGEVQLSMLLQDFLAPSQYIKDAQVRENSRERVEYAIRLPMGEGEEMLLPVDAKFPREDHDNMIKALEGGDAKLADHFRRQLENRIKSFARDICQKYINPPRTTERAILFLPTESLFAEVLRQPGLFDYVQRECHVMLAGPTTFAAILHAFQINHRSMAVARQSGEVWKILGAVRSEFKKYNETVGKVARQLHTAAGSVAELDKRTQMMDRALKRVETMPDDDGAARLLGFDRPPQEADRDGEQAVALIPTVVPVPAGFPETLAVGE